MNRIAQVTFAIGIALSGIALAEENPDAKKAYADIETTFGSVPTFLKVFPVEGIAGAWSEMKSLQLNPHTALSNKEKELIGLAVAAQIPCHYCVYFHTESAKADGATDEEVREAIAMSALTRHWSTVERLADRHGSVQGEYQAMMKFAGEQEERGQGRKGKKK